MNLLFQSRFADKVASGEKRQTIRPPRKDGKPNVKVGQLLSLRKWEGKPYWSKQVKLREDTTCKATASVKITKDDLLIRESHGWCIHRCESREAFAKADGFESFTEMATWFEQTHTLPFTGVLIQW